MKNMTIRGKLFTCFSLIVLFAAVASLHSVYTLHVLRSQLKDEIDVASSRLDQSRQITTALANMRSATRGVSLFALMNNAAGVAKARSAFEDTARQAQDVIRSLAAGNLSTEESASVNAIRASLDQWLQDFPQFANLSQSGHAEEASQMTLKKTTPVMDAIQKGASDLGSGSLTRLQAAHTGFAATLDFSAAVTLLLAVLLTIAAGAAFTVVVRLVRTLRHIANSVATGAEQVASASAEISAASQSFAQGASEQAASLEETSASTEEISATAQRNRENSQMAADLAAHSREKFQATDRSLNSMVVAMGEINASSDKISRIVKVIDEIAFQTNILALNAAVEAARAGAAGSGFALVADEVRNLARRCAQAAQEIAPLIGEAIAKSGDGKTKVDDVAKAIRAATADAGQVKALVNDVSNASSEQARGIEQIGIALTHMGQVTQKTAAGAEQAAAAAEQLTAQSQALNDIVTKLTQLSGAAA